MMAAVPQKNSAPELVVRRLAHAMGYRFRLHRKDLPGSPDVVFPRLRKVVFVHGCFWHRHGCKRTTTPSSNKRFWQKKFSDNQERDRRVCRQLRRHGWEVLMIWECQTERLKWLEKKLQRFLRGMET
jgi:DNA mismatch endonuclease (patch repair protein)